MALLSILICTIPDREEKYEKLIEELYFQKQGFDVEILTDDTPRELITIGAKRNRLLERATGKYVCFIDDDDTVSRDYVKDIVKGCQSDMDCVSLRGVITMNGQTPEIFEHSIKYKAWATTRNPIKYERYPNHLNPIKAEIAKQFKYPETYFGEDHDWSTQVYNSGLIKTEYYIDKVLYNYLFVSNK